MPGLALGDRCLDGGSAGSVLHSQGTLGPAKLSRGRARGIRMSTFQCSLRPGPAAAGLLEVLSPYGDGLMVAVEEKQSSLIRCVVVMALGRWGRWGRGGGGGSGKGEAFGVPQRGNAYQHGVKPRVGRTTGAF